MPEQNIFVPHPQERVIACRILHKWHNHHHPSLTSGGALLVWQHARYGDMLGEAENEFSRTRT
jgi:hypothetical protein